MSFSSNIKEEILYKSHKEKKTCCIEAMNFGELLTSTSLKNNLMNKYKKYFEISKLSECCIKSILKGAFLESGYIADPKTDYHFEISFKNKSCAEYFLNLLSVLDFMPKLLKRKNNNNYIIYFKESEQISLFLSLIESTKALLKFENVRVEKNVKNNINRNINCETANLSKTISASVTQLTAIEKLKKTGKFNSLNEKLKYTAALREKYPHESLEYISSKTAGDKKITKSGLKHRLDKLVDLANKF